MKLERLISMIYMLLNNEVISASELAEKYQVSQRTIYRDIDAICAAGIPVVSYQGVNGGYGIMETYKMDKSLLSSFDIETLLTMLNGLSGVFVDEQTMDTVRKLQTIRSEGSGPGMTLEIENRWSNKETLRLLRSAIKSRKVVYMEYMSLKNERTNRTVEPICLMYKNRTWYLYGFCRSRKDYREFRLSRMTDVQVLAETFHRQHEMPVQERGAFEDLIPEEPIVASVRFSRFILARALDYFNDREKHFHSDGTLTVTLRLKSPEEKRWLFPILLSFGEEAELEEPAEWRTEFKTMLEHMLNKYAEAQVDRISSMRST
ncbi:helix-turn-helix transcriptional regulator [Paenibacillus thermotolerans]|uniref:helix-turn-helix transcriptional regulator n=1 Tax=Paenibacillus thermotolerans TaxID=3027807 RepID=UPI0023683F03|nr:MULTISPECIES: YafY family protein [unclassified Paenibacillus]